MASSCHASLFQLKSHSSRLLEQKIRAAGKGSISSEIRNAIKQYLAGPKQIEAAFLKLLKEKAPKDPPTLLPLQAKLNKTLRKIDRTIARVTASERRMEALDTVDTTAIGLLALNVFGSSNKVYTCLHHPNRTLGQRTPY